MFSESKNDFTVWELPQDAIARYGSGALCDLAVSPDGTSLAAGTGIGVWLYDLATHQPVMLFETERGMVADVAFCPSQPLLAVNNSDKDGKQVIKIWDMQKQKCIAVMEYPPRLRDDPPDSGYCSLCFSPSGQWLAVNSRGEVIVDICESLTGRVRTSLELPDEDIALCNIYDDDFWSFFSGALAFSPDNCLLASSHWADFITVWDITIGERIIRLTGHFEGVHSLSFSPCGQFLAAGRVKGTVQVWETSTWQLQQTYSSFGDYHMNVSYAPDSTLRAAGISHDQSTVTVWDVARSTKPLYTFQERSYFDATIFPIHFSNGTHLAFQSDFEVKVKSVGDAEPLSILSWELGDLHSLVFSPDGQTLCAGYRQFGGVVLWDAATHRPQHVVTEPRCHIVNVYSDTSTGNFYAAGLPPEYEDSPEDSHRWGNTLNLWEIGQSEPIAELTIPGELPDQRRGTAYAPATNLLAYGHGTEKNDESWDENDPENGAVYVWDVARGQMRHIFRGKHTNRVHTVRFSADGTRLQSMDYDDTSVLWDVMRGEVLWEFPDFNFIPKALSPCGNLIAGHFSFDEMLVRDVAQCEICLIIDTTFANVDPVAFSPCSQYLAFGEVWQPGLEKVPVQLWDIRTGAHIATFLGHPTDIQCLAFSPDGTILASGSFDHTILLWDLKPYLNI